MGNSQFHAEGEKPCSVTRFYSSSAWIEGKAEDQLTSVSTLMGMETVAAFPDLHPGKYGPVGSAMLASRLFPRLVGNDIGCGMSLYQLDISPGKLKLDKAAKRLRALEGPSELDSVSLLEEAGLPPDLAPQSLGTIGGGNHFCELQSLCWVNEAESLGLDRNRLYLLVHSGSRALGLAVFSPVAEHPGEGYSGKEDMAKAYLAAHDEAVLWAKLNRQCIAMRAAKALRADISLVADSPHNQVEVLPDGRFLHRKGAALAKPGALVPLAGSRESNSHLMLALPGVSQALTSLAHGAGRKYDRSSMHGRVMAKKSHLQALAQPKHGARVICEDKALLVEEAANAYKNVDKVAEDLAAFGLARSVARFTPLITFKKARLEDDNG